MSVNEGLICPECMKKFQSLKILQDHFQQCHIEQSEITNDSNGFLGLYFCAMYQLKMNYKGIIRKAKKTFEDIIDIKDNEAIPQNSNIFKINADVEATDTDFNISYAFYEEPNTKPQPNGK